MQKKIKKRASFGSWISKNRIKVILFLFIVIVPLTFIVLTVSSKYEKINFSQDGNSLTYSHKDFISLEKFTDLKVTINNDKVVLPKENDQQQLNSGYYQIVFGYKNESTIEIESVKATFIMQTPWKKYTSTPYESTYTSNRLEDEKIQISFNHLLPVKALLFLNVEAPILYIKLDVTTKTSLGSMMNTYLVKQDLSIYSPFIS